MQTLFFHSKNYRASNTMNSIRDQLQRQTQDLLHQRNSSQMYQPSAIQVPFSYERFDSQTYTPHAGRQPEPAQHKRQSFQIDHQKKKYIKSKIKQIIQLCKEENTDTENDFNGVIKEQKQILNLLQQIEHNNFRKAPSNAPGRQITSKQTPIQYAGMDEYRNKPQMHQKETRQPTQSVLISNSNVQLSGETLQLIEQIERRALFEVEKLRAEKMGLINKLNQEINNANIEKIKNGELSKQLDYYRGNRPAPSRPMSNAPGQEGELKSRVAYLQNLLYQEQQKSQALRWQLQNGNMPDLSALYAQAEAIRKDTIRLLKLKEAKHSDDEHKRALSNQIEVLRQKVDGLQRQNAQFRQQKQYKYGLTQQYSPIPTNHRRQNSYRNSANQYESLVLQMRKIANN